MSERVYGYYLHYFDLEDPGYKLTGVDKKVKDQISELNRNGLECRFLYCSMDDSLVAKAKASLFDRDDGIVWPSVAKLGEPSYLYLRRPRIISESFIRFLEEFKARNPNALVFYEIPTYPYDNEMRRLIMRPALRKDRKNRQRLSGVVDYIVDLTGETSIFGIPTVQIGNGIDLARIEPREPLEPSGCINLVCAANYEYWHGMDRMLYGLHEYHAQRGERKVQLHLAGGGSALGLLKKLADKLGLSESVSFYGPLASEELDRLYDACDLGIECLGVHRRNSAGYVTTSIKSKEYLAKGLPFIFAGSLDVADPILDEYVLQVPSDDSPIDINEIVRFHDIVYKGGRQKVIDALRVFAEERVSMASAFKNVIGVLKEHMLGSPQGDGNLLGGNER